MGGLIGGLIGFLLTKRIYGAILGYMIGSAFTNVKTFRNGEGSRRSFAGGFGSMGGAGHNQGYYRQQINQNDFATALLVLSRAYIALGIEKTVTDSEVKKAYRKMAVLHHPDKYEQMGEEHQKAAKEKFQKIQEAYETIKKERGFS